MLCYIGLSILSNTEAARKSGRKKLLSAEARRILSLLAGEPVDENSIAKSDQGRPFFPGREVDFNIAHSGSVAAVSFVKGAALRTGCDIELVRPRPGAQEIAKTFFSAAERNYLYQHGKFNESRFYEIWTLKECYLKLRGLSVFDMPDCPSFINDEGKRAFCASLLCPLSRTVLPGALSFRLYELSGGGDERYILATAIEGTEQSPPEIRWFSQSSLACKMTAEIKAALNPAETVRPKI
jgi:phosphopantetheinyl transferase